MSNQILLNNSPLQFTLNNLPCLIHGAPKAGSSLFTVSLVSQFYNQGRKILFMSGYHMARDEFKLQTGTDSETFLINDVTDLKDAFKHTVIFVKRENSEYFKTLLNELPDIDDRVILIKNFELFDESLLTDATKHKNIILSGNIDDCVYKDKINEIAFKSKIFFSKPQTEMNIQIHELPKYHGLMWDENFKGEIKLGV